jgi:hypothetical protein
MKFTLCSDVCIVAPVMSEESYNFFSPNMQLVNFYEFQFSSPMFMQTVNMCSNTQNDFYIWYI